jgi:23S rRNA pseudouridine1911/1915/1917 synthase
MISRDPTGEQQYFVPLDRAGSRLDRFLKERLPTWSHREIAFWIREGRILCNGRPARKGSILREGDRLDLVIPAGPVEEGVVPEPDLELTVLWEDPLLAAVDKAPGMPTHPLRRGETGTVANGLIARYPEMQGIGFSRREPGLLHRLDRDTSGVLLAARTSSAFERLRAEFAQGRVVKDYLAVVHGRPESQGVVTQPVGTRGRRAKRVQVVRDRSAACGLRACSSAETRFRVLRYYRDFAFVRLRMTTGARHQLRAHMAFLGHPVVGDLVYGVEWKTSDRRTQPARQLLHAAQLRFFHPSDGSPTRIRAPLPADMRSFLKSLALQ